MRRVLASVALVAAVGCRAKTPAITELFSDGFDRAEPGPDWRDTGADYRIAGGKLTVAMAHNHPLWLRRKLPRDVVIELDVSSKSPDGDIKVELFGDGESFDPDGNRYDPTGYVLFMGGHRNSESVLGRLGEHDAEVKAWKPLGQPGAPRVDPGRTYHWQITRQGGRLTWLVDGAPYLAYDDPSPLQGSGHEFFAVNDWETEVTFDNLTIRPAP